mmetsp:Transcript_4420/g.5906  ORF Transcript_4420/g.5906 Transcript_4420/m.5906 type:complete len:128 (-) Transcript_4420:713-1096(-)
MLIAILLLQGHVGMLLQEFLLGVLTARILSHILINELVIGVVIVLIIIFFFVLFLVGGLALKESSSDGSFLLTLLVALSNLIDVSFVPICLLEGELIATLFLTVSLVVFSFFFCHFLDCVVFSSLAG